MPNIGDTIRGTDIGRKDEKLHIWRACPMCGGEQWVVKKHGAPGSQKCRGCAVKVMVARNKTLSGPASPQWKGGGGYTLATGYRFIAIGSDSPYYAMANCKGHVYEHRLVMAEYLGRCLDNGEAVHHENCDLSDNRIENLRLMGAGEHTKLHAALRKEAKEREGCTTLKQPQD